MYSYTGTPSTNRKFPHTGFIRGGTGSKSNDIYYFNVDENLKWGMRRLGWNSVANDWSGTWTSRNIFTNGVIGSEYSGNDEIITKPAYDPIQNRVYLGVPQWKGSTLKDSQTLYYVASDDSVTEAGDVYNHKSGTFFAPTMDIMYNTDDSKLYIFYETSATNPLDASQTNSTYEGNGWYRTYDGSSFGTPQPYLTQNILDTHYTLDTPTVYKNADNGRIILYHRIDGSEGPFTPPHYITFGYISSGGTVANPSQALSSLYSATTYADFDSSCAVLSNTQVLNSSGGEIGLASDFRDDFETPRTPYPLLFDKWTTGTWFSNYFIPSITGNLLAYTTGGAYGYGTPTFTNKVIEFRAKFTAHNFQHIGFTDGNSFNKYILFSTAGNSQLNTEQNNGSEVQHTHGTSYLGSFHTYKIDWGASNIKYYIDDVLVDTISSQIPTIALNPVFSNATTSSGSDLTLDWIHVKYYSTTTGTYQSCSLDSQTSNAVWGVASFNVTLPSSTSLTIQTRTSPDNSTWSAWSSGLTSGNTITSPNGRYLQYRGTMVGTSTDTPTLNSMQIAFAAPTATPTMTPTPTATPTPITTSSSSNNTNNTSQSSTEVSTCKSQQPGDKAPWLYGAIAKSSSEAEIYFTDADKPVDHYVLAYGTKHGEYQYGVPSFGEVGKGQQSYTIRSLAPDTTYYVRVKGANGCAAGAWSNEISVTTKLLITTNYLDFTSSSLKPAEHILKPVSSSSEVVTTPTPTSVPNTTKEHAYSMNIQVKDTNNKPVAGATVQVHSKVQEAITDKEGIAHFSNLEPGNHTVLVAYNGYKGQQSLNLTGDTKHFDLTIKVQPQNVFVSPQVIATITLLLLVIVVLIMILFKKKK